MSPASTDTTDHAEIRIPPRIRDPASAATAGTPTSTPPTTTPNPSPATATVSTPGRASTPIMPREPLRAAGRVARTAGLSANPVVPTTVATAATRSPVPGHGAAASSAASAGPSTKNISMLIAS